MLLGYPSSAAIYTSTKLTDIANYYGLYVQDDFRVSGKLTVNVGLRLEHEPGLSEVNNGMLVNFDGTATNPLAANLTGISPKGVAVYAGNGRTTVGNPTFNKMGPRAGFAFKLDDKTVIRGGYGIFWAPQFAIGSPIATVGYNQTTSPSASVDNNQTPALNLTNAFTSGILQPAGNSLGALTGIGQSFSLVDPSAKSPYVQQYSLDVQRELPAGIATEIGFVGSKSTHLTTTTANINLNALDPSLLAMGSALTQSVANPFYQHGGAGVIGTANVQRSQLLLPYPAYGTVSELFDDSNKAKYYSLVVKAQKRFSHGMSLLSTLTWSHNWDEAGGGPGNTMVDGGHLRVAGWPWESASQRRPRDELSGGRLGAERRVGLPNGLSSSDYPEHEFQLGVRVCQPASERDRGFSGYERKPRSAPEQLHQPGGIFDGAAAHVRQPRADHRYARPRPGELGSLGIQECARRRAVQGAVPLRGSQRFQYAAVLRAERFVRQQQLREDHQPGELLAATSVGDAFFVLTTVQRYRHRSSSKQSGMFWCPVNSQTNRNRILIGVHLRSSAA